MLTDTELKNLSQLLSSEDNCELGLQLALSCKADWYTIAMNYIYADKNVKLLACLFVKYGYKYYNINQYTYQYHKDIIEICESLKIKYYVKYLRGNKRKTDRVILIWLDHTSYVKVDYEGNFQVDRFNSLVDIEETIKYLLGLRTQYGTN